MTGTSGLAPLPPGDLYIGEAIRGIENASVTMHEARNAPGMPVCFRLFVVDEALAMEQPSWVCWAVRQGHFMVYGSYMLSWNTNLNNLDIVRGKQHAMPDFWRLDNTITSMQAKFRPLILIYKINPASDAENQLKPDRVIMNHIRHRPTIGDANMAGNDRSA